MEPKVSQPPIGKRPVRAGHAKRKAMQVGKDEALGREPQFPPTAPAPESAALSPGGRSTEPSPPSDTTVAVPVVQAALNAMHDDTIHAKLAAVVHRIMTDQTYAHNLKVRLAVMEYGDGGPLGELVDAIAKMGAS